MKRYSTRRSELLEFTSERNMHVEYLAGSTSTKVARSFAHCISPFLLRMNVRRQIGRDLSNVDAVGHDFFLYSDCSIQIYFGDGEGTVAQRTHFALQGIAFQHNFVVYSEVVFHTFTILVRLR